MIRISHVFVSAAVTLLLLSAFGCNKNESAPSQTDLIPAPVVYEYVDLGLPSGTLWAAHNLGSEKWKDAGTAYAWAETESKKSFDWDAYLYCKGTSKTLTKYNYKEEYGDRDSYVSLLPEDDAARKVCGKEWRIPA